MEGNENRPVENEEPLVREAQLGNQDAIAALMCQAYDYAMKQLKTSGVPESDQGDVCQSSLIAVFRTLEEFDCKCCWTSWVYRQLKWKTGDYWRKKEKELKAQSLDVLLSPGNDQDAVKIQIDDPMARQPLLEMCVEEDKKKLHKCIAQLSEKHKRFVQLKWLQEKTKEEVMREMGLTDGSYYGLNTRSMNSIRELLSADDF
jgi:RNA polymerase sigma factor (sigma-70 family)